VVHRTEENTLTSIAGGGGDREARFDFLCINITYRHFSHDFIPAKYMTQDNMFTKENLFIFSGKYLSSRKRDMESNLKMSCHEEGFFN
jgi:sigma54-dependent transcription regulator